MSRDDIHFGNTLDGKAFRFPLDLATEALAFIGRKGSGKTYAAKVWCEELLANHVQTVVIDPLDVWWGLRSPSSDRTVLSAHGYDIAIFGGSHGDLVLPAGGGRLLADVVVDRGISVVLVLDHLSMEDQRRFVADFCEQLFERKRAQNHRTPLHLIIDEADAYAPQRVFPDMTRCLGAVDRLVRRGRSRGIGATVITQRPAVLSKDVLTQTEVLITLQVVSPQDRAAVTEWIKANADTAKAHDFLHSLAELKRGEAWVWSPGRLRVLARIHVRLAGTFDSSYTPKIGEKRREPKSLRPVDIAALSEQLATVVAETEANDPAKLRAKVRELEKKLAGKVDATPSKEALQQSFEEGYVEAQREYRKKRAEWSKRLEAQSRAIAYVQGEIDPGTVVDLEKIAAAKPIRNILAAVRAKAPQIDAAMRAARAQAERPAAGGDEKLSRAERSILTVLWRYPQGRTKVQVALMTGYAHTGGGFNNALSRLRTTGLLKDEGERLLATPEGASRVAHDEQPLPPAGETLVAYWMPQLSRAERRIVEHLRTAYPHEVGKDLLAQATEYEANGGGFNNALSRLRTLELIEGRNVLKLSPALMGDA